MSGQQLFKQCPDCQQFSPEKSDACLQCGHNFNPAPAPKETRGAGGLEGLSRQPPEMSELQTPKKKKGCVGKMVLWTLAIVVLIIVIGMIGAALSGDFDSPTTSERPSSTPVPTFTSTPLDSTASETTGQTDTQAQEQTTTTSVPPTPEPPTPVRPTATPISKPMVTVNNDINVRGGPGTNYPIIGTASIGQQFLITGKNGAGDWWKINYNGQAGWVFGQLVAATNAEPVRVSAQPTSTPTPRPARPTATVPIPLSQVEREAVWVSMVNNEYGWLEVFIQVTFEVDTYDLDVLIHGKECSNDRPLYDNEPATEIFCGILEYSHSSVSDVRVRLNDNWRSEGERERYRCERNKASTHSRSVFACARIR